jgi:hypothetical protein
MREHHVMRILISIVMILGACLVVVVGLLSVVHDLLLRTTSHIPSEFDAGEIGRERPAICHETSDHLQ